MAEPTELTERVLASAHGVGFELVGICEASPPESLLFFQNWLDQGFHAGMDYLPKSSELRSDPTKLLPGVQSIVAVGLNYNQDNPIKDGHPRIARYALGRDYHKVVRGKLRKVSNLLLGVGYECRICVDSAPLLEREFALRAGLGWFGKNSCLINSERGSWFLIGMLLTTAKLTPTPKAIGGCGTCTKCIEACPTGAIVQSSGRWVVNSGQCISYLTIEHRGEFSDTEAANIGEWTFGCDICQEVCPFNTARASQPLRAQVTQEIDFLNRREWPSLVQILQLTPARWDDLTRGSPIRRTGLDGLKRNAKANLDNQKKEVL